MKTYKPRMITAAVSGLALAALATAVVIAGPAALGGAPASAATCDDKLVGWATVAGNGVSTTTGGGNAAPQTITTLADLVKYGGDATPRVLRISGTITTGSYAVDIASNKTLIGADSKATIHGGINIKSGSHNIIVRNLNFQGFWPNSGPDDTIAARGAHHLWFDHLNIWDATDGEMDLTLGSDFITVSWVKFWYSSTSHPHRLSSLVSSGADHDDTDVGKLNVTYHHNWFADKVNERMPRILYGKGHVYNDYYTSAGNLYAIGVGSLASVLVENNYFKNVRSPHQFMYVRPSYITARGNIYDNTTGAKDTGAGGTGGGVTPFTNPPYSYTADPASAVPALVQSCAGPTLAGGSTTPTTKPTTASPTPTRSATASPTPPAGKGCTAVYSTVNSWEGGFQGKVTVKAGSSPITGWTVQWSLGSGQSISQVWNGKLTTSGSNDTVTNESYNGTVAAGASTTFGLLGTGTATTPTLTCTSA